MIGVFDSGFGGLTIFKDIEKKLPNYDYIYLGDNARAPYGNHSQAVIYQYTKEAVDYLFSQGCSLIILACNTASAEALRKIQQEYLPKKYPGKNVLGVIRPLVEAASSLTNRKVVGVMGTRSTVESGAYIRELKAQDLPHQGKVGKKITVVQEACPLLVPLIEESMEKTPAAKMILKKYVRPLKSHNPDVVILGCTHYGWMQKDIQKYFGTKIKVLDSGKITADKLAQYLAKHPEYNHARTKGKRIFLTTDNPERFDQAAKKFLGRTIKSKKINLT